MKLNNKEGECPEGCPVEDWLPKINPRCNCHDPLMISIPNGKHIHLNCPVHGDRILRGSDIYC